MCHNNRPSRFLNGASGNVLLRFLMILFATVFFSACGKQEGGGHANIRFIDPAENELQISTWSPGDSLIVTFSAEAPGGRIRMIDAGLGRYTTIDQSEWEPAEVILFDSFQSNREEEVFTIRWKLPEELAPTSDHHHYRLLFTSNPERRTILEGGNLQIKPIRIEE